MTNPGDQTNYDGDVVSLAISADDNLGDTLAYSAAGLPTGLSINAGTGLISGTIDPAADANGPYAVTVTATGGGSTESQAFAWTVNNPISIDGVFDQTNALGDTVLLPVPATTATGDTLAYSAADLPDGLSISSTTGLISGTVASTASFTTPYDVTVTAADGAINASTSFVWTVSHLTLTNPGDQTNVSGDTVSLALTTSDHFGGDTPAFQADGLPPGLTIDDATGLISGTIDLNADAGSPYTTTVTLTGGGYTASQTFPWSVARFVITDPGDQNSADNDAVSLQVHGVDNHPDALTYSETGLPPGLTISSGGLIGGTIAATADAGGPYTVTVTAQDGQGHSASDTFFWSVTQLTLANPGDQSNADLDAVNLPLVADGPSGVPLQFTETGLPDGLTIAPTTGVISGAISATADLGSPYNVVVTVKDGSGAVASQAFAWAVDQIYLADPGDQTYAANQQVALPVVAHDNDSALTFSETGLPTGLSVDPTSGEIEGTVAAADVSATPYQVMLEAEDGDGNVATVTFGVEVEAYTVKFSPDPVITGYLIGSDGKPAPLPNPVKVRAIVSDSAEAGNIDLTPAGPGKDRIKLTNEQLVKGISGKFDTVTATVIGLSPTPVPPAGQTPGDTTIEAAAGTDVKASVNVIVVVPTSIKTNHVVQTVKGKNMGLNSDTSPARLDVPKDANGKTQVDLATVYAAKVAMTVLDQFGNPLN